MHPAFREVLSEHDLDVMDYLQEVRRGFWKRVLLL